MSNWQTKERDSLRVKLSRDTYAKDKVLYWKSNDRPVPPDVFRRAERKLTTKQIKAHDDNQQAFLEAYRKARQNYVPSVEEQAEMRAAFGPDVTVVDVLTKQRFRT